MGSSRIHSSHDAANCSRKHKLCHSIGIIDDSAMKTMASTPFPSQSVSRNVVDRNCPVTIPTTCASFSPLPHMYSLVGSGVALVQWLDNSPPTKTNRVRFPVGLLSDFCTWVSCRTMPLAGGFSLGSPVCLAPAFRRHSILTSITLIGSQDLDLRAVQISSLTHSFMPIISAIKCEVLEFHPLSLYVGNTTSLARRSDESLGVRVSVALIAHSLLDLGRGVPTGVQPRPEWPDCFRLDLSPVRGREEGNQNSVYVSREVDSRSDCVSYADERHISTTRLRSASNTCWGHIRCPEAHTAVLPAAAHVDQLVFRQVRDAGVNLAPIISHTCSIGDRSGDLVGQ
ncbi:hypothetical protein PR048_017276 [Dryococelus australis]|uniref:Uncharacterized protein n=1 Tax=Dryococelus australis TaxID=614101 RepID=A0ABQ9H955_9NEOP|nr:hypothetical protein PR048_017276 [Dryococelus australis]